MIETRTLSLQAIEDIAMRALVAAGTSEKNARPLAIATAATEADGVSSHGLAYIPIYCEHVQCGKVDGQANPLVTHPRPAVIKVDAATGFAHAAIDQGFAQLIPLATHTVWQRRACSELGLRMPLRQLRPLAGQSRLWEQTRFLLLHQVRMANR
jgi:hypothetical protein